MSSSDPLESGRRYRWTVQLRLGYTLERAERIKLIVRAAFGVARVVNLASLESVEVPPPAMSSHSGKSDPVSVVVIFRAR